jgi:hypothetical protein
MNQTAIEILRAFCQGDQSKTWDKKLHYVQFIMNSHVSASTRKTPFEVLFGYEPYTPLSLRLGTEPQEHIDDTERAEICHYIEDQIEKAQKRMIQHANLRRVDHQFKVGDLIKLKTDGLNLKNTPAKFKQPFIGPFPIEKVMGPLTYRLKLPPSLKIHPVFHVSQFHDYHQRPLASPEDPDNPATITEEQARNTPTRPGPVLEEDGDPDNLYEVEAILEQQRLPKRHGDKDEDYVYRLKWTGWEDDPRFYPYEDLIHCPKIIAAWREKVPLISPKKETAPEKIPRSQSSAPAPTTTAAPTHAMNTRSKTRAAETSAL